MSSKSQLIGGGLNRIFHYFAYSFCAVLIASVAVAGSTVNSDIQKAKQFMEKGMYPQAKAFWQKVIDRKPKDGSAYFQSGICDIYLSEYDNADRMFMKAIQLDSQYAYSIADEYKKAALKAHEQGNNLNAIMRAKKAEAYEPGIMANALNIIGLSDDVGNVEIELKDIKSRFVGTELGSALIISGMAINKYDQARTQIKLIGKLFSNGKIIEQTRHTYCGHKIDEKGLSGANPTELIRKFELPPNINVSPGGSLPFHLLFYPLPKNKLEEFTVHVERSTIVNK